MKKKSFIGWLEKGYRERLKFGKGSHYYKILFPVIYKNQELGKYDKNELKKVRITIEEL